MKNIKKVFFGAIILSGFFLANSCKEKDPSIMKVFVRNQSNELQNGAKVVIVADVNSNPPTPEYVDTIITNSSGFAFINMEPFFEQLDKKETTGYFDILVKKNAETGEGYIRARAHITNVETVYIHP
jgi:hypothetical protein